LSVLTKLTDLSLYGNQITTLAPLTTLTQLKNLSASNNKILNLSFLTDLTELTDIDLSMNKAKILPNLAKNNQVQELNLSSNFISNLTPLTRLKALVRLDLNQNGIDDISPLSSLVQLKDIRLQNNRISDLTPLSALPKVTELQLANNRIEDISPLLPFLRRKMTVTVMYKQRTNSITLMGNPLGEDVLNIIKKGHKAIVAFYDQPSKDAAKKQEVAEEVAEWLEAERFDKALKILKAYLKEIKNEVAFGEAALLWLQLNKLRLDSQLDKDNTDLKTEETRINNAILAMIKTHL
jgi:Leucine-rich repeat (LRR) protein